MTSTTRFHRGVRALRLLLRESNDDIRGLDPGEFRGWLARQQLAWSRDPVFQQRLRIRDLRRAHPEIRNLEHRLRQAVTAEESAPGSARRRQIERELIGIDKAIEGLSAAFEDAASGRRKDLRIKLAGFRTKRRSLTAERTALVRDNPEHRRLCRLAHQIRKFRSTIGIDVEEARLLALLLRRGQRGGRAGAAFEVLAAAATRELVLSDLRLDRADRIYVLTRVTLGAARVEFDVLVVRQTKLAEPVAVLAAIEAKRNINDLAHGFLRRQEDLAWLTGEGAADRQSKHRTRTFPSGRFDREVAHLEGGCEFRFGPSSFGRFRRDPATELFLERLYLVTRRGPMFGVASSVLGRLACRAATDERWDPAAPEYLARLQTWCLSQTRSIETPDVIRLYAAQAARARRLIMFER